ncbi:MAG: hypothetical protein EBU36_05485 [Verrucomicrobia bacterium]|nr:hypothetical protein [Verrucomicrobiota bacterium]
MPTEVEIGAKIRQRGGETSLSEMAKKSECTGVFTFLIAGVEVFFLEKMTMIDIDEAKAVQGHLFLVRGEEISSQVLTTVFTGAHHLMLISKCLIKEVLVMKRFAEQRVGFLNRKCVDGLLRRGSVELAALAAAGAETSRVDRHGMCAY